MTIDGRFDGRHQGWIHHDVGSVNDENRLNDLNSLSLSAVEVENSEIFSLQYFKRYILQGDAWDVMSRALPKK